ncbi:FAD binding domain protein [Colletotrichum sojae]|uniref:FAD binding domain protein n=1 Tax=Colletotrichum sojae TaxID=2175907 RepID=A0A8H6MKT0_9PEZI|nr:FAD binding domain protein [Colletotrichum sojae]
MDHNTLGRPKAGATSSPRTEGLRLQDGGSEIGGVTTAGDTETDLDAGLALGQSLIRICERNEDLLKHSEGFLPEGTLTGLLQPARVREELRVQFPQDDPRELDRLAKRVCYGDVANTSYRRVFAISCMVDDLATLKVLLEPETGICDGDLPLKKHGGVSFRKNSAPHASLRCFHGWDHRKIKLFDDYQWTVLAPVLGELSGDCPTFDHRMVLPLTFRSDPSEEGGNGGFSDVFKVRLHPQHHVFSPHDPESGDDEIFEQELRMLGKFNSGNTHPHIVSLLTAWRQGEYSYFLFPWADSDLLKYWERHPPVNTAEYVQWVARQTAGLAEGLAEIHDYRRKGLTVPGADEPLYGRHGDIKPENILWFNSREGHGNLVISDFGLSAFNSRHSRSGIPNSGIASTPTYRPPECDIMGGKISRSWDIWTLGCLYAEFATWLLGGGNLIDDFTAWRLEASRTTIYGISMSTDTFFDLIDIQEGPDGQMMGKGARIRPIVTWWFKGLHNNRGCTQYVHDLLKFVQERMLIVESSGRERAKCSEVVQELHRIYDRCLLDEEYCTKPVRWGLPPDSKLPPL